MKTKIVIGSITYAQKARRALSAQGIRARLIKADSGPAEGCVYGIELTEDEAPAAIRELRRLGIDYRFLSHDLFR
ncbi:MAG: DUF3343 domain-containing protein [Clostridia bacterium]|nr:DUF3343 domain-containing protein [Clostridia bacterium]